MPNVKLFLYTPRTLSCGSLTPAGSRNPHVFQYTPVSRPWLLNPQLEFRRVYTHFRSICGFSTSAGSRNPHVFQYNCSYSALVVKSITRISKGIFLLFLFSCLLKGYASDPNQISDDPSLKYYNIVRNLSNLEMSSSDDEVMVNIKKTLCELNRVFTTKEICFPKKEEKEDQWKIFSFQLLFIEKIGTFEKLEFLESIVSESVIKRIAWPIIKSTAQIFLKLETDSQFLSKTFLKNHYFIQTLLKYSPAAINEIKTHVKPEDTLIAVGNTPQYLIEIMGDRSFCHKIIQIAISGHPGTIKNPSSWVDDIITPQGIINYRKYLSKIGFFDEKSYVSKGVTWFLDFIGMGGAINFLSIELEEKKIAFQMKFMAMNTNDGEFLRMDGISLNLNKGIIILLDQCSDRRRIMPSLPAYKWGKLENFPIPGTIHTEWASLALEIIKEELNKK